MDTASDEAWTGTYWNPAESGTGFFFEKQGAVGIVTLYLFEATGRSVWYSALGQVQATTDGYAFSGTLLKFAGGQHATSTAQKTPVSTEVGPISIDFTGQGRARVTLPARTFDAQKLALSASMFPAVPAAERPSQAPEAGIYWNPAESGRGFTIEVINGYINLGVFHYDSDGQPIWHLVTTPLGSTGYASGEFASYRDGQALAGSYRAPSRNPVTSQFQIAAMRACQGQLGFPGMNPVDVQRFSFNAEVAACRTVPAGPSFGAPGSGSDSGGSAGGATPLPNVTFQKYAVTTTGIFRSVHVPATVAGLGGKTPRYAILKGPLPNGVQLDTATGALTGVPLQTGTFTGQIALTLPDQVAGTTVADFELTISGLAVGYNGLGAMTAGQALPAGTGFFVADGQNTAQQAQLVPGATFGFHSAVLPFGVTMDMFTGQLSGRPQMPGFFPASVKMDVRYNGAQHTVTGNFTFHVQ